MVPEITSQAVISSFNPANNQLLGQVKVTPVEDISAIVEQAKTTQVLWRKKSLAERLRLIANFHDKLVQEKDAICRQITAEAGKPYSEALVSEVFAVLETCVWLQDRAETILAQRSVELNSIFFMGKNSYNEYEPLGVIAVISPWNYPFSIPATSMLLALAAGNAVVLKPSPKTPLVAIALVDLFRKSGFPEGLVGLVQGDRDQAETLILSGVGRVVFTGSVGGGKAIMQIASQKLVPVTLELGGKHPAIVLPDTDADKTATALVWSAFTNCGQACASIDRLYLVKPAETKLLPLLTKLTAGLRLGNGTEANIDVGPLIDEEQLRRIEALVEDAVSQGARVLSGGKSRDDLGGFFFEPCLITDLRPTMRLVQEEIFGPILPIFIVDSVEEAVRLANQSEFGLAASIWTADEAKGADLARKIEAGVVWVNDALYSHVAPDAPWGGIKCSGFGKAHGEQELLDMVYCKNIGLSAQGKREWHYPYSVASKSYVEGGVNLLHQNGLLAKFKAIVQVLSAKGKISK